MAWLAKLKAYFGSVLQDRAGYPSSKRWLVCLCVAMIFVSWVANIVWKIVVDSSILDAVKWLGTGGVSAIAGEYIGKKQAPEV